jgi:Holliday junction resolvase RusA-like endonuclease
MAEKKQEVIISMPLFVWVPMVRVPDKKYIINLNNYRNWHRFTENKIKNQYALQADEFLRGLEFEGKVKLEFTFWKGSKRKIDRANVLSIHEKYFCDAMVHSECIADDNDNFIESTFYQTGGLDRENPRVDIKINEI